MSATYPLKMGKNPAYEALLRLVVANPMWTAQQYADQLRADSGGLESYTPTWIRCIIASDAFQAKLKEENDGLMSEVQAGVKSRMTSTTQVLLGRIEQLATHSTSLEEVSKAAESLLDRMGFNPKTPTPVNPVGANGPAVNINVFAAARASYGKAGKLEDSVHTIPMANISPESPRIEASENSPPRIASRLPALFEDSDPSGLL